MAPTNTSAPRPGNSVRKTVAENVKETLESIVVAFILAFVFRAFIVEAFVIPTGSMAVTLYGMQLTKTCSTCGYEYALGVQEGFKYSSPMILRCPNCSALHDRFEPPEFLNPDSGDRILVHKWPFDVGGSYLGPKRWDVTVFKDPRDGVTNFIKRLVGLPGEVIEIIDGDVYAARLTELPPELIDKMEQLRLDVARLRLPENVDKLSNSTWTHSTRTTFIRRYQEVNRELLPFLKIQRKVSGELLAQESLWFNVYNQDFLPHYRDGERRGREVWVGWRASDATAAQAWKTDARELVFESSIAEPLEAEFTGKRIDDFYAYNNTVEPSQLVGDIRVRFELIPESDKGALQFITNRNEDEFTFTVGVDGTCRIEGLQPELDVPGHRQVIGEKKLDAFEPGQAVSVEFINLDYRVALRIDGEEVIASTPQQYGPQLSRLLQITNGAALRGEDPLDVKATRARLAGRETRCRIRHLVLERDVYYRAGVLKESVSDNPYYQWLSWGTAGCPMMLRTEHAVDGKVRGGEYFMLGDNSPASKDSRLWLEVGPHLRRLGLDYQLGTVPDDQLIGKAFFVYWPAGYRPAWASRIGMIPNFGRMRWIR